MAAPGLVKETHVTDDSSSVQKEEEEEFETVQEKVDSWKNDSDGLDFGFFRVDPPKPFGNFHEFFKISLI